MRAQPSAHVSMASAHFAMYQNSPKRRKMWQHRASRGRPVVRRLRSADASILRARKRSTASRQRISRNSRSACALVTRDVYRLFDSHRMYVGHRSRLPPPRQLRPRGVLASKAASVVFLSCDRVSPSASAVSPGPPKAPAGVVVVCVTSRRLGAKTTPSCPSLLAGQKEDPPTPPYRLAFVGDPFLDVRV